MFKVNIENKMNILNEHKFCLENKEAEEFIAILKAYQKNLNWIKSNNTLWRSINFVPNSVEDELGGTTPGAVIQIEFKYHKRITDSGKIVLTLFKRKHQEKLRAYQLEISSENKITSHNGIEPIYGTHEHIGKEVIKVNPKYGLDDITNWFTMFCDKINLNYTGPQLNQPNE